MQQYFKVKIKKNEKKQAFCGVLVLIYSLKLSLANRLVHINLCPALRPFSKKITKK